MRISKLTYLLAFISNASLGYATSPISDSFTLNVILPDRDDSCTYCNAGGYYVRFNLVNNGVGGEFDGKSILYSSDEIFLLPRIENSYGFGIAFGVGFYAGKFEIGYVRSEHNISFLNAQGKSNFNMINIDFNFYVMPKSLIKPYIMFGLCGPWFVVKDGSATIGINPRVGDESFSGIGYNIGSGLELFVHDNLMIDAQIVFHRIRYGGVTGVRNEDTTYDEGLNGSGTSINIGFSFYFALFPK